VNPFAPFGKCYSIMMDVRNRLYDSGILRSYPLGARTISIGNLTAGGTGKTPMVAYTARMLAESGEKVCILTRGYGRTSVSRRVLVSDTDAVLADAIIGGDEPVELARKLLGKAIVVADADRVAAAKWARERFGITAFVLDDAFQHRRAKRDADIVCVDATNPWGNGHVLPAGTLRESFNGLKRADAIVITRTNLVDSTGPIMERLRRRSPSVPIFAAATRITGISKLEVLDTGRRTSEDVDVRSLYSPALAFCGLGNPGNFRKQLEMENFRLAGFRSFGDHHRYEQRDADRLDREAGELSAKCLMTTAKDAVKLEGLRFRVPVFVVETEMVLNDAEEFRKIVMG
jgi:tetraacyldisaccharide 4'-kinase